MSEVEPVEEEMKPPVNPDAAALQSWTEGGHEEKRYQYPLDNNSIVFDLGAFHLDWSIKISDLYQKPTIYAFEPIPSIWTIAKKKAKAYPNIKLLKYALGKGNSCEEIWLGPALGVSSSFFITRSSEDIFNDLFSNQKLQEKYTFKVEYSSEKDLWIGSCAEFPDVYDSRKTEMETLNGAIDIVRHKERMMFSLEQTLSKLKAKVVIRSIKDVFEELDITEIDLMKLNIEGSEYDVLECMIEHGLHTKVKNIQVQFHRLTENYEARYRAIQAALSKTHQLTYEFTYIWENWERK